MLVVVGPKKLLNDAKYLYSIKLSDKVTSWSYTQAPRLKYILLLYLPSH